MTTQDNIIRMWLLCLLIGFVTALIFGCNTEGKKKDPFYGCNGVTALPGKIKITDLVGIEVNPLFMQSNINSDTNCTVDSDGVFRVWGAFAGVTMTTPPLEGSGFYMGNFNNEMVMEAPIVLGCVYPMGPFGPIFIPDEESTCLVCYDSEFGVGTFDCLNLFMYQANMPPNKNIRIDLAGGSFDCNF